MNIEVETFFYMTAVTELVYVQPVKCFFQAISKYQNNITTSSFSRLALLPYLSTKYNAEYLIAWHNVTRNSIIIKSLNDP